MLDKSYKDEYKCINCNSVGEFYIHFPGDKIQLVKCNSCNGTGKVDWIKNIFQIYHDGTEFAKKILICEENTWGYSDKKKNSV